MGQPKRLRVWAADLQEHGKGTTPRIITGRSVERSHEEMIDRDREDGDPRRRAECGSHGRKLVIGSESKRASMVEPKELS